MTRAVGWGVVLVWVMIGAAMPRSAASATAQCRRECAGAKRTCVAGAKSLFRSAAVDCRSAVSKTQRKSCSRDAKTSFRNFKQACGTSLQACRRCCSSAATTGAACTGTGTPVDTSICPNAHGGLGAYWDWLNGVFHPLTQIPTAGGLWSLFSHPDYPLLGFRYPPEWIPTTIAAEQTIGVNLFRGDGAALWRYLGTWGDVSVGPRVLGDTEVAAALNYLGLGGQGQLVCLNEGQAVLAPGIVGAGSNVVVTAGAFTIIVISRTTSLEGLAGGQIFFNTIIAPTAEIDRLAFDVFLPIHFQLFVGKSVADSDLDGVPDDQDNFPSDPTRS